MLTEPPVVEPAPAAPVDAPAVPVASAVPVAGAAAEPTATVDARGWRRIPPWARLVGLAVVVLALVALYLFTDVPGSVEYAVKIRSRTVLAMLVVAAAVGASTVVFQTITGNRILTPSIMGFDAFYILVQTFVVFFFGATVFLRADELVMWSVQVLVMVAFAAGLFTWMFAGKRRSIHLMLLVGIVLGTFFRSFSSWMQRMIDPVDFQVLQDAMFASLTRPDRQLLLFTGIIVAVALVALVPLLRTLDVLALGERAAIGLGVRYKRTVLVLFAVVSVMIAASTALVGPILFFGLIVANLAYSLAGSFRHRWTLPMSVLLGMLCLLGGQVVLERVFHLGTTISVVIEFAGGLFFLFLVLRKGAR